MSSKNFVAYGDAEALFTEVGNEISASKVRDKDMQAALGAPAGAGKNFLVNTATSKTQRDVTFTVNADKSVTVDGTSTAEITDYILMPYAKNNIPNGTYIFTSEYFNTLTKPYITITLYKNGVSVQTKDMFNTGTFSFEIGDNADGVRVRIFVQNNASADNITFHPMIRPSGTSADYVPHSDSIGTDVYATKAAVGAVDGAGKNWFINRGASTTINNVTVTINSDKSVTVSTTEEGASANTTVNINAYNQIYLPQGQYIWGAAKDSDDPIGSNIAGNVVYLYLHNVNGTSTWIPSTQPLISRTLNITDETKPVYCKLYVSSGTKITTPITFYPMIRSAYITDSTYVPYSPSLQAQVDSLDSAKQPKTLATPLTIGNVSRTTVEAALGALNNVTADLSFYLENNAVTLSTSAATTVTFSSAKITTSSCIDVGVSEWGLVPDDVTVANGTCTVTMPQVDSARTVTVRVYVK